MPHIIVCPVLCLSLAHIVCPACVVCVYRSVAAAVQAAARGLLANSSEADQCPQVSREGHTGPSHRRLTDTYIARSSLGAAVWMSVAWMQKSSCTCGGSEGMESTEWDKIWGGGETGGCATQPALSAPGGACSWHVQQITASAQPASQAHTPNTQPDNTHAGAVLAWTWW